MQTKYGAKLEVKATAEYFEELTNRIFKLLSMHISDRNYGKFYSSNWETIDECLYSLLCELAGGNKIVMDDKYFIQLINIMENLSEIKDDYKNYRSQVLKSVNVCGKIAEILKSEGVDNDDV